jgi:hypothetical protein
VNTTNHFRLGLLLAVGSAFAFGSSGPFAKSLMESGRSPTAAVIARPAGGPLAMAVFATIVPAGLGRRGMHACQDGGGLRRCPDRRRSTLLFLPAPERLHPMMASNCRSTPVDWFAPAGPLLGLA